MTPTYLPPGKTAAICFSVDDLHPGKSVHGYEAGGDLQQGALGRLVHLQRRHPQLKLTLCVTPDWRLKSLVPDGRLLRHVPGLKHRVFWTRRRPAGYFRVDRHPEFVACLNRLERCETVLHGLTHTSVGPRFAVEFQDQSVDECAAMVSRGRVIFERAKLRFAAGYVPPAWNAPPALIAALDRCNFDFVFSARDLRTPVSVEAVAAGDGLKGVSLIFPQVVSPRGLIHFSCNFQATSPMERAFQILDCGGVLHVKAHIFKAGGGHVMLDGVDELYCNYLDALFTEIARRYGDGIWWAQASEVAARLRQAS